ncbi:MAG: hypothetical protein CMA25_05190 [Euryarchaeota archaeon]|mgnify:FL=1|nr:hypothetical protein [Euryarchaeota archaeon]|tara:strand:+ start:97 stop:1152 length:1056 start_codon:yes stop_codon:yes gene_type:complete
MGRDDGKSKNKPRWTRSLTFDQNFPQGPTHVHDRPKKIPGGWSVEAPVSSRLYQKSALGKPQSDESILLLGEEVLFCHWHRHIPLPHDDWLNESVKEDPELLARATAFEQIRSGGERLVPVQHVSLSYHSDTWALRWSREKHPSNAEPDAEVRWVSFGDPLDLDHWIDWAMHVESKGRTPELALVDDEFEVTLYQLDMVEFLNSNPVHSLRHEDKVSMTSVNGLWYTSQNIDDWNGLGIEQFSGIVLRDEEFAIISQDRSDEQSLLKLLHSHGLTVRSGFRYGTKWRLYERSMEHSHAPWLMDVEEEAPENFRSLCLLVRLAEGVHKRWVYARFLNGVWHFLSFRRWLPGR